MMLPKVANKLKSMRRDAEETLFSRSAAPDERCDALGAAIACDRLLAGDDPEALLACCDHPLFRGAADLPEFSRVVTFFKDLI